MLIVISYDTPDDKRRVKLAKLLAAHGERVQYSVFEAHLDPRDLKRLRARVGKLIDPSEDSVRFYTLADATTGVVIEGQGRVTEKLTVVVL